MGKVEEKKIWCNLLNRIILCLKPTIPTAMFEFIWLINGHLVIPAVNIQRHRCIRRWRVYPTMFLNHANLSSPDSLWAPSLRTKFGRIIILGRKHSGNDLSFPFFSLSVIFRYLHFFFFSTYTLFPPIYLPINILDISYVFSYVHVYLYHTILHDEHLHLVLILIMDILLFFSYRYDALGNDFVFNHLIHVILLQL